MLDRTRFIGNLLGCVISLGSPDPSLQPADPPLNGDVAPVSAERVLFPSYPDHRDLFDVSRRPLSTFSIDIGLELRDNWSGIKNLLPKFENFQDSPWKHFLFFLGNISVCVGLPSLVTSEKRRIARRSLSTGQREVLVSVSYELASLSEHLVTSKQKIRKEHLIKSTLKLFLDIQGWIVGRQTSKLSALCQKIKKPEAPSKPAATEVRDDEFMGSRYGNKFKLLKQTIEGLPENLNEERLRNFFLTLYKLEHEIKLLNKSIGKFPRFKFLNQEVKEANRVSQRVDRELQLLAEAVNKNLIS